MHPNANVQIFSMMKRAQKDVGSLTPGGKRRFLGSSLQAPIPCDNASREDTDAEMLYYGPDDDSPDKEAICYGAVSLKIL